MRILKVADVTERVPGGMNLFMRRSGDVMQRIGHEVDYLFREDLAPGVPGPFRRVLVPWVVVREVWRLCRSSRRPDVVEIHEPLAAPYCALRRHILRAGLPPGVVVSYGSEERHWRATLERARVLGRPLRLRSRIVARALVLPQARYALRHADHVLVPSDRDGVYLRDRLGIPLQRLTRVDSGVDDGCFDLEPAAWDGVARILFIGTWIDRKGIPELARAWSIVSGRNSRARLTVACTVAPAEEVLAAFDRERDRVDVRPLATEDELAAILASHHIFVLPAWFEGGMPLATLQAAAAGLPCVVSAIGGHIDIFRPEDPARDGGVLVPPHDGEAVADALLHLIANRELASKLGENARRRARLFTWPENALRCLSGYRSALCTEPVDSAAVPTRQRPPVAS
jgi:glycosyltransferase involved in cell wall biosynthesis